MLFRSGVEYLHEVAQKKVGIHDGRFVVVVASGGIGAGVVVIDIAVSDFTVDMLCSLHHMSRSSFYNKVKALTDCSPADYVRLIRMQYAARMLKEGEHSITEIADMTGFCDAKYFREVFRKHFGVSPSEYRGKGTAEKENSDLKQDNDGSVSK